MRGAGGLTFSVLSFIDWMFQKVSLQWVTVGFSPSPPPFFMYKSLHLWLFFQLSYSSFVCIINVHRRPESALPITRRSLQEMNKTWPSGRRTQGTSPSSSQLYIIHSVHRTDSNSRTVQNKMSAWYLHANQGYVTLVVFYTIPTNVCEL